MNKLSKILAILNLILWTALFISLFFIDYYANELKYFAMGSMLIVEMGIAFDLLGIKNVRIKIEEKQGDK